MLKNMLENAVSSITRAVANHPRDFFQNAPVLRYSKNLLHLLEQDTHTLLLSRDKVDIYESITFILSKGTITSIELLRNGEKIHSWDSFDDIETKGNFRVISLDLSLPVGLMPFDRWEIVLTGKKMDIEVKTLVKRLSKEKFSSLMKLNPFYLNILGEPTLMLEKKETPFIPKTDDLGTKSVDKTD
mgnify:FL=1